MIIKIDEDNLVYSKLLEIPPMAKQSTNFNARTKRAYTSTRAKNWMYNVSLLSDDAKAFINGKHLIDYPVVAVVQYSFAYTSKFTKRDKELIETYSNGSIPRTSRPDVQDNLNKAFFDSLSFIKDDSYVVKIIANKVWSQYACIQLKLYAVDVPDEVIHLCHGKA